MVTTNNIMATASASTTPPTPLLLTTRQFHNAILNHVDEFKPDPLVKKQMTDLRLHWHQKTSSFRDNVDCVNVPEEENLLKINNASMIDNFSPTCGIFGVLTLSSEYISIAIHVRCQWRIDSSNHEFVTSDDIHAPQSISYNNSLLDGWNSRFNNEIYFRLDANASTVPLNEYNKSTDMGTCADTSTTEEDGNLQKPKDRKERSMKRKVRSGMLKRLSADPLIRKLLVDGDKTIVSDEGILLCEALIQQNEANNLNDNTECEERVNVNSESIEGIRNAILSHCEDNLDVLELLLNLPYLPRDKIYQDSEEDGFSNIPGRSKILKMLSERAFQRILEDAMFDACEKEGEDELLDDLTLSDDMNVRSVHDDKKQRGQEKKKKKC